MIVALTLEGLGPSTWYWLYASPLAPWFYHWVSTLIDFYHWWSFPNCWVLRLLALALFTGLLKIPIKFPYRIDQITNQIFRCVGFCGVSKFVGHNFQLLFRSFISRLGILGFLSLVCLIKHLHFWASFIVENPALQWRWEFSEKSRKRHSASECHSNISQTWGRCFPHCFEE